VFGSGGWTVILQRVVCWGRLVRFRGLGGESGQTDLGVTDCLGHGADDGLDPLVLAKAV